MLTASDLPCVAVRVAQFVDHLPIVQEVPGSIPGQTPMFFFSFLLVVYKILKFYHIFTKNMFLGITPYIHIALDKLAAIISLIFKNLDKSWFCRLTLISNVLISFFSFSNL